MSGCFGGTEADGVSFCRACLPWSLRVYLGLSLLEQLGVGSVRNGFGFRQLRHHLIDSQSLEQAAGSLAFGGVQMPGR